MKPGTPIIYRGTIAGKPYDICGVVVDKNTNQQPHFYDWVKKGEILVRLEDPLGGGTWVQAVKRKKVKR